MKLFNSLTTLVYVLGFAVLFMACQSSTQKAEMVVTNAVIWTGDDNNPTAQAMAISGDTIVAVGSVEEIKKINWRSNRSH